MGRTKDKALTKDTQAISCNRPDEDKRVSVEKVHQYIVRRKNDRENK